MNWKRKTSLSESGEKGRNSLKTGAKMSNEINHEGKTYILKSQVEGIIKDRISKIASKASEAERRANELETSLAEISNKTASLDVIAQQLEEMKGKLSASENRFERYQAVSKYGITEPDIIEAIEYSYEKEKCFFW